MYLPTTQYNPSDFQFAGNTSLAPGVSNGLSGGYSTAGLGATPGAYAPAAGAAGSATAGAAGATGLGFNVPTAQLALSGLGAIGNIMSAFNAQKLAKKQFEYQKGITDTNLANSIQSYNTTLADRGRARAAMEGQSPEQAAAYLQQNSLRDRRV